MNISDRLKEERKRLKMSQPEFGALGGAGKTTVIAWERGDATPNAAFLALAAAAGADVRYIITGDRDAPPPEVLSPDERYLLDRYRSSAQPLKDAALRVLIGGEAGASRIRIGGKVQGQVVEGGLVQNGPVNIGSKNKIKK